MARGVYDVGDEELHTGSGSMANRIAGAVKAMRRGPSPNISTAQVIAARARGLSIPKIAREFGVSETTVNRRIREHKNRS